MTRMNADGPNGMATKRHEEHETGIRKKFSGAHALKAKSAGAEIDSCASPCRFVQQSGDMRPAKRETTDFTERTDWERDLLYPCPFVTRGHPSVPRRSSGRKALPTGSRHRSESGAVRRRRHRLHSLALVATTSAELGELLLLHPRAVRALHVFARGGALGEVAGAFLGDGVLRLAGALGDLLVGEFAIGVLGFDQLRRGEGIGHHEVKERLRAWRASYGRPEPNSG